MSDSRALLNIVLSVPGILGIAGIVFRARGAVLWRMAVLVVLVILLVLGGGLIREFAAEQDSHRIHAWTGMVFSGFWSQDFSFHFDLFSLGQGLFMSWASLTALLVDGKGWAAHRSKLSALLLFLSGVLGAVFAGNLLTFAAFSLVGLFPGVMVIGWDDSKNSAVSAVRFGAAGAAGTVLLLITYLGLHPVVAPVDIRLVGGFGIKDTLFWMFAVALLARAPIVPFHASQWTMLRLGRLPHLLPVMLAWNLGLYGLFRFGPMLFPDQ
ncbi:MAG: hypothetical protein HUU37_00530, partial [Bdellovibrionales bacterium]|nr:hypothetical protein [Bdellovibrionales bacterium]